MSTENSIPRRKPAATVCTIKGEKPELDKVTDADYLEAIAAQDATLYAQGLERKILGRIRTRLLMGAQDVGAKYYLDTARGIVRRRENESAG